ncbi:MAG: ORF6C domain-containing protein [Alphaproteobacteria bacterium]|nr:ORF6C domain-containing protein [Alphaproteobacteria bacterium]MBF0251144.1 ORF6C domain-containing protein [Alphaproteobacteria bacterium]
MDDENSKVTRLRNALTKGSNKKKRGNQYRNVVSIHGKGNVAIGDNTTINVINTHRIINRTEIDPTGGELSPAQKQRLKDFVDGIVGAAKGSGQTATHAAVWKRFQRNFKVNTYHALPASKYEAAKRYLKTLYGRAKKGEL